MTHATSRRRLLWTAWLAPFIAAAPGLASTPASLTYVDSSQGLRDAPLWEAGDSEFEMADVNGDGHIDLISIGDHGNPQINSDEEGIMVWLGNGQGSWTYRNYGWLGYGGVAVGDVNGDGTMDLGYEMHHDYGAADLGDQILEVALGDGSATSWTAWDDGLATNGEYWGMFSTDFGDLDGDGDLDLGSVGFGATSGIQVYLNDGDGTWRRSFGYLAGNSGHVFAFGDVDGDGRLDLAAAKQEGTVWLGDGDGFLTLADGNLPPEPQYDLREGPSLGDVDGDGRDDLAFCNNSLNAEVWLWRPGANWLSVSDGVPDTGTCQHTQLHDMDADGRVDLVTFGRRTLHVFGGDGTGQTWTQLSSFTVPESPGDSSAFRVGGDADHNGYPDMVLVSDKRIDIINTRNTVRLYREGRAPGPLSARVVAPGPNRRLLAGAAALIEWAASVPAGQTATVTLELSATGTAGPWETITLGRPNSGRFQWLVPPRFCDDCRLRVTAITATGQASAVSSVPFTIARRPDPLGLTMPDRDTVSWSDSLGRPRWHLYRGDLGRMLSTGEYTQDPSVEPQAARFCDLMLPSLDDPFLPSAGTVVFYLVTGYRMMEDGQTPGVPVPMAEGSLGQTSLARTRPNDHPCPM